MFSKFLMLLSVVFLFFTSANFSLADESVQKIEVIQEDGVTAEAETAPILVTIDGEDLIVDSTQFESSLISEDEHLEESFEADTYKLYYIEIKEGYHPFKAVQKILGKSIATKKVRVDIIFNC